MLNFLNYNNILCKHQYGFRKNHSTNLALFNLTDTISKYLDGNNFVGTLFLDLRKAFDTVNHSILLSKLKYYGIKNETLNWFSSYLSSRYQRVEINNHISLPLLIKDGVPQGSV